MLTNPAILVAIIGIFSIVTLSAIAGTLAVLPPAPNQPLPWWEDAFTHRRKEIPAEWICP